jgi:hypothetical protein
VLGFGASWAFQGVQAYMRVLDSEGSIVDDVDPAWLRHVNQYTEAELLAGPPDEEVPSLRATGYRTAHELDAQPHSRLDWETLYSEQLKSHAPSRAELRIWLLGRELTHEHQDVFDAVLDEYPTSRATDGSATLVAETASRPSSPLPVTTPAQDR